MNNIQAANARFLSDLNTLQARNDRAQQQLSSGYRVTVPSDDPIAASDMIALSSEIGNLAQLKTNLGNVKDEVDTAESTVSQAVLMVQKAISLAAQGASSGTTTASRQSLGQQVQQLLDQMIGLTKTQVQGQFIFSGDSATQATYQENFANPNGVDRLVQATSTRVIQDSNGMTFAVSRTAEEIFDHRNADDTLATDNVFAGLNQLRLALNSDNEAGIASASDNLKKGLDWLDSQLGFYGAAQNRIQASLSTADQITVRQKVVLGERRDADIVEASLEVTQTNTGLKAAMAAQAQRSTSTLFDYLK